MYLVHQPEGSEEPTRYEYLPRKLMSAEREMLERKSGKNFSEFTKDVLAGSSVCRRALLFMFIKRDHPGTKYDDVDFAWGELTLEYSKGEYQQMRDDAAESLSGDQRAAVLERLDAEIETAYEDPGKAERPIAD